MSDLGTGVFVGGQLVAWFADFNEDAEDWCTTFHFGQWVTWRCLPPVVVPLTPEEQARVDADAAELFAKLQESLDRGHRLAE